MLPALPVSHRSPGKGSANGFRPTCPRQAGYDMLKRLRAFLSEKEPTASEDSEKRRHKRHSVLLQATIYPIDSYCEATIHDISDGGLMGEAQIRLTVGQVVHLTLEDVTLTARVQWTRANRFGLARIETGKAWPAPPGIDHGEIEGQTPRGRRLQLGMPATLRTGGPPRPVTVRNLSQGGMLVEGAGSLVQGQQVLVHIGKRDLVAGSVQWSDGTNRLGIQSKAPIGILSIVYSEA